jgi:RHS repeat-associated protein
MTLGWSYNVGADNGNVMGQTIARTIPVAGGSPVAYNFSQSFGYADPANRLLMANEGGGWAQNYIYDAFGNRMLGTGSYAPNAGFTPTQGQSTAANQFPNNRWVRGQVLPCGTSGKMGDKYDCAGNQIQLATAVSPYNQTGSTFTYDGENRLLGANVANQGGAGFVYDGEGRRVEKITPSATTTYIHDAKGELAMEVSTAAPTASGTEYLTADTLGSTRLITDASGNPTRCLDYLPFGEEIPAGENGRTGPCYESLGSANTAQYPAPPDVADQKFTGKERDAETGLDYFGARYFSGAQGRFTSADPKVISGQKLSDPQQWNMYSYTRNNPLQFVDPDGKELRLAQGADASKLIPVLAHAYTKAEFRTKFDALAASKNVHLVNNVGIKQDPAKEILGIVEEGHNLPKPADPSQPISNTNLVNTIELDNTFVLGPHVTPEGQDFVVGHEFDHGVKIDSDPAGQIAQHNDPTGAKAQEDAANKAGNEIAGQKPSMSTEKATQAVEKALGCSTDSAGKTTCK